MIEGVLCLLSSFLMDLWKKIFEALFDGWEVGEMEVAVLIFKEDARVTCFIICPVGWVVEGS